MNTDFSLTLCNQHVSAWRRAASDLEMTAGISFRFLKRYIKKKQSQMDAETKERLLETCRKYKTLLYIYYIFIIHTLYYAKFVFYYY